MLYATMSFWLLVILLTAWGVHEIWSALLKPRTVNSILLPGTLVAQLGHVLGLLITGATVTNTTLYKDDDSGAPEMTADPKPRIPVVGPVVIGMLPMVACIVGIVAVMRFLGSAVAIDSGSIHIAQTLPTSLSAFWQLLRDQVTLVENALSAAISADWSTWQVWLFVYLVICLTVRMAPFPGTLRGSLGATLVLGIVGALTLQVVGSAEAQADVVWNTLGLTVATLTLLLLASLVIRGAVSMSKMLAGNR